jgi:hypothetical protein
VIQLISNGLNLSDPGCTMCSAALFSSATAFSTRRTNPRETKCGQASSLVANRRAQRAGGAWICRGPKFSLRDTNEIRDPIMFREFGLPMLWSGGNRREGSG